MDPISYISLEFVRLMDGEHALSKLNYGSEWYLNPIDTDLIPNSTLPDSQLMQNGIDDGVR